MPIGYNKKLSENEKICIVCKKHFRRKGERKFTARFCSIKCKGEYQKGKSIQRLKPKSGINKICEKCSKVFYTPLCYLDKKFCSRKCYFKSDKFGQHWKGESHFNWKGGITPINQLERKSYKYTHWRTKVFKRDKYTCQACNKVGGKLEAHHIKSWAEYPKIRFIIKNGLTLCKKCHEKTDNYKRTRK